MRAAPAARSPCDLWTHAVIPRRAGVEPRPYEGLEERGGDGGGRREGSSRTPTPTGLVRRHGVCGHPGVRAGVEPRPYRELEERGEAAVYAD